MPTIEFSRRTVLAGLAATAAMLALGRAAFAQAGPQAAALVQSLSAELTKLVNSGATSAKMNAGFQGIFGRYADVPAVAASVLGPPWRTASKAQQSAFVAAFQSYLAKKYGAQFGDYKNAKIEVKGSRDGGKAGVLVNSVVHRPGQSDIAVDWQVSDRSGAAKVVNLVIEGVSLLATERAEIGAMLDASRGDIDGLIAQLKSRS